MRYTRGKVYTDSLWLFQSQEVRGPPICNERGVILEASTEQKGAMDIYSIWNGVISAVKKQFPHIEVREEDAAGWQGEPCFFVKLVRGEQLSETGRRYKRKYSFDICYVGGSKNNQMLYEIGEQLYEGMEIIDIGDIPIRSSQMRYEGEDGRLHFLADYWCPISREKSEEIWMQTFSQKEGVRFE